MPQKNSIKRYYEKGFYHVYNRGVEKRNIFLDRDDYLAFLHLLKTSLSYQPRQGATLTVRDPFAPKTNRVRRKCFEGQISLHAYCLMPNHFHMLLSQNEKFSVTNFMRTICTSYSMYFNKKYDRVGALFQGIFKAIDINDENYLLWVSRYIHRNPNNFLTYDYSSYGDYIGKRQTVWVNTKTLLSCFSNSDIRKVKNYREFVEGKNEDPGDLCSLLIETE